MVMGILITLYVHIKSYKCMGGNEAKKNKLPCAVKWWSERSHET